MKLKHLFENEQNDRFEAIISQWPNVLASEFRTERPNPDEEDALFVEKMRLINKNPIQVKLRQLLQHPDNIDALTRTPQDVVDVINKKWKLNVKSGKQYEATPERYFKYAKLNPAGAAPSIMLNGEIIFGVGRYVAALLRGDETLNVWNLQSR